MNIIYTSFLSLSVILRIFICHYYSIQSTETQLTARNEGWLSHFKGPACQFVLNFMNWQLGMLKGLWEKRSSTQMFFLGNCSKCTLITQTKSSKLCCLRNLSKLECGSSFDQINCVRASTFRTRRWFWTLKLFRTINVILIQNSSFPTFVVRIGLSKSMIYFDDMRQRQLDNWISQKKRSHDE